MAAFSCSTYFIAALSIVLGIRATCPPEWLEFGSSCYAFAVNSKKWVDAQALCQSREANLLVIDTPEENDFVSGEMVKLSMSRAWIGCRYEDSGGQWLCYHSDDVKEMSFINWAAGEPRTPYGCVMITKERYHSINCDLAAVSLFTACETASTAEAGPYSAPPVATCLVMDADGRPVPNPNI